MLFRSEMTLACKFQLLIVRQLAVDFARLHKTLLDAIATGDETLG